MFMSVAAPNQGHACVPEAEIAWEIAYPGLDPGHTKSLLSCVIYSPRHWLSPVRAPTVRSEKRFREVGVEYRIASETSIISTYLYASELRSGLYVSFKLSQCSRKRSE